MTFRHRHSRLRRLIEIAEVVEGKAEVCEEEGREIGGKNGPDERLLLVSRRFALHCTSS